MSDPAFLLIDENPFAVKGLVDILNLLKFRNVRHTSSTVDGWSMMRLKPAECIICSWDMPDMSGLALLRILRSDERMSDVAFFLSRTEYTPLQVLAAGKAGVSGLIVKPYSLDVVRKKVKTYMDVQSEPAIVEARASLQKGLDLLETGDTQTALSVFEKMIAESESAEVYYNIGYIKTSQKKYDEALVAFQKATQLDRLFARAYEAMGRVYKKLGQLDRAENCLQKAADIYVSKEEDDCAEQVLREILEISPDTINVYNSLGVIFRKKKDFQSALKYYNKALKVHPGEPNIYYNIGRLHIELNRSDEAKIYFQKALAIDPSFKHARDVLRAIELGSI
ncbi:MAG: tetratricopeptide repeat protein [Pseudomonadota bacterium]